MRTLLLAAAVALAAPASAQGRFTVSADGQDVRDATTNLVWRRCAEGTRFEGKACVGQPTRFTFAEATRAAKAAASAAQGGAWRVPTRDELVGLLDKPGKKRLRIADDTFPQKPTLPFWATRDGSTDPLNAWLVNFKTGRVTGNIGEKRFPLRLVRAG